MKEKVGSEFISTLRALSVEAARRGLIDLIGLWNW